MAARTARDAALEALCEHRRRGRFVADALTEACRALDTRETALAYQLAQSVVQNRLLLDAAIDECLKRSDTEPLVRDILRLGAAQLLLMRTPSSAAVNEAVKQARRAQPRAAGMVNAILRRLSEETPNSILARHGNSLGLRYSFPDWLLAELMRRLGPDEIDAFGRAVSGAALVTVIANPLNPPTGGDISELTPHPWLPDVYHYNGAVHRWPPFGQGRFLVADAGARLIASALGARPGMRVWDTCAAPGGKSCMLAMDMLDRGTVLSTDLLDSKLPKIQDNARRLGLSCLDIRQANAAEYTPPEPFDAVLCDVPCSGLGVLAKKPDIRWKDPAGFARLPELQSAILHNASGAVKPGGVLVYSTCTFRQAENEDVIQSFLEKNPEFTPEEFTLPSQAVPEGMVTLWPQVHGTDAFFIAKLRRRG